MPEFTQPERDDQQDTEPTPPKMIRNLRELCDHFGADDPAGLNRRLYKDTACGASISLMNAAGAWLHNGAECAFFPDGKKARRVTWKNIKSAVAFTIQTIVEGSDATVDSLPFTFPVAEDDVRLWMEHMEAEAARLYDESHDEDGNEIVPTLKFWRDASDAGQDEEINLSVYISGDDFGLSKVDRLRLIAERILDDIDGITDEPAPDPQTDLWAESYRDTL